MTDSLLFARRETALRNWVHSLALRRGFDEQTIDVHAYVDVTLSLSENRRTLGEAYPDSVGKIQLTKDVLAEAQAKQHEFYVKQNQEQAEAIALKESELLAEIRAKSDANPTLEAFFAPLRETVRAFCKADISLLVVHGGAGMSKSFSVITELASNYPADKIKVISGHCTLLKTYAAMYEMRDGGVCIFDDLPRKTFDSHFFALMKAATWGISGRKVVSWNTTSKVLEQEGLPTTFDFAGKVVIIANELPDSDDARAVFDRSLKKEVRFSLADLKSLFVAMAKLPFGSLSEAEKLEVADFLVSRMSPAVGNLSLRLLVKGLALRSACPSYWQSVLEGQLLIDEEKSVVLKAIEQYETTAERVVYWLQNTGKSRATYFRRVTEMNL